MLVDEGGTFVTRRSEPRLAHVSLSERGRSFTVFAPDVAPLDLPIDPELSPKSLGETVRSVVWRDTVEAREHSEGSAWFSSFLGKAVRLVYLPEPALRQVDPEHSQPGDQVSLADGYPLLLANEASLDDLNGRLDTPIPMARFRPNVSVAGVSAYAEDTWKRLRLGEVLFDAPKLCDRCVVTTIEEGSARGSKEPLKTLASYRRWAGAVWFATNLVPRGEGVLRVGDALEVLEEREHPRG
jgi:uncharacterized protein YcbX